MIYVSNTYLQKTVSCVCRVNTYIPQNDLYYADDIHDNYDIFLYIAIITYDI